MDQGLYKIERKFLLIIMYLNVFSVNDENINQIRYVFNIIDWSYLLPLPHKSNRKESWVSFEEIFSKFIHCQKQKCNLIAKRRERFARKCLNAVQT